MEEHNQVFVGKIVHCADPEQPDKVSVLDDGILIACDGKIVVCESLAGRPLEEVLAGQGLGHQATVHRLGAQELLIPGLVDTHIHAPQVPNAGLGYDRELLDWLQAYTFPLEACFRDIGFAQAVYDDVVRRTLGSGTTLACYFATVHKESSVLLARSAARAGQRALVGKVCMNINAPTDLQETREGSLKETKDFVRSVKDIESPLVQPVITPRFALSCDMELMTDLAAFAHEEDLHIQTHVSENKEEVAAVRDLYATEKHYCGVYDRAGLLTKKTVLAHGVYLTEPELLLLAARGTSVAHCPASNTCLRSGLCDVRRLMQAGLTVGLGSDVSGGPSLCILDAARSALDASMHLSFARDASYSPLSYREAFYLATLGGAKALAMDDRVGNFQVGKELDALLVRVPAEAGASAAVAPRPPLSALQLLQKFIYCGREQHISEVFVCGRQVKPVSPQ